MVYGLSQGVFSHLNKLTCFLAKVAQHFYTSDQQLSIFFLFFLFLQFLDQDYYLAFPRNSWASNFPQYTIPIFQENPMLLERKKSQNDNTLPVTQTKSLNQSKTHQMSQKLLFHLHTSQKKFITPKFDMVEALKGCSYTKEEVTFGKSWKIKIWSCSGFGCHLRSRNQVCI